MDAMVALDVYMASDGPAQLHVLLDKWRSSPMIRRAFVTTRIPITPQIRQLQTRMSTSGTSFKSDRGELQQHLPRLVAAYHRGLLVPFLGAGMSRQRCPSWYQLVVDLESWLDAGKLPTQLSSDEKARTADKSQLIRRANRAVGRIARRDPANLASVLRDSLYMRGRGIAATEDVPEQTRALARLWWPLVVSTNYDDLFARAYAYERTRDSKETDVRHARIPELVKSEGVLRVLGRGRSDVQHVLDSLTVTSPSILWAIHGFLPGTRSGHAADRLARELVVGHDEYRRLAHAEMHYRRAFAEVWRRRSLLFLGSSLEDPYLLDLFAEVQEFYGANPQPHYALIADEQEVDVEFLRSRFNIIAIRYGAYGDLRNRLLELAEAVAEPGATQNHWRWSRSVGDARGDERSSLEIVRGELPKASAGAEAPEASASSVPTIVSAGFTQGGDPRDPSAAFGGGILKWMNSSAPTFAEAGRQGRLAVRDDNLLAFDGIPAGPADASAQVVALRPWRDRRTRDLRLVRRQFAAALDHLYASGARSVRSTLIGAGQSRHFPANVALTVLIRAWADWHDTRPGRRMDLTVYLMDEQALFELTSGRIDVAELLTAKQLRLWVTYAPDALADAGVHAHAEREPCLVGESETLRDLAARLDLVDGEWSFELEPSPTPELGALSVRENAHRTLAELGVIEGATVRFRPER